MTALTLLDLHGNRLSGPLPETLGNLSNLHAISFAENMHSGTVPTIMASFENLGKSPRHHLLLRYSQNSNSIGPCVDQKLSWCRTTALQVILTHSFVPELVQSMRYELTV